jgi:predicted RNase H-like nuclease (RuvC/YqgF family)
LAKANNDLSEATREIGSLQSTLAEMRQAERQLTTVNDELRQGVSRLEAEVKRLSWKPYDEHQYTRVREILGALTYIQRDLLRLVVPLGQCKNEVIYNARVKMTESFDINGLVKPLSDSGLMTMTHDIHSGSSTYTVNQSFAAPLRDALFPRDEGGNHPFFKGI